MRSWRRASRWLDCGGPDPHCRIEAGAPYQRVELAMGTIKDRCVEHATEPVNEAQIAASDDELVTAAAERSADAGPQRFASIGSMAKAFDGKAAAAGKD